MFNLLGKLDTPLWLIALWKKGFERGDFRCRLTEIAPALSPKIVTLFGSPPNDLILSLTHLIKNT